MTSEGTLPSTLVCAGCGASPLPDEPHPFRCASAGAGDDTDHVLRRHLDVSAVEFPTAADLTAEANLLYEREPPVKTRRLAPETEPRAAVTDQQTVGRGEQR